MQNNKYPQKGILRTMQSDYAIATGQAKDASKFSEIVYKHYNANVKKANNQTTSTNNEKTKEPTKPSSSFFDNENRPGNSVSKPGISNNIDSTIVIQQSDIEKLRPSTQNNNSININDKKTEKAVNFSGVVERSKVIKNPNIIIQKSPPAPVSKSTPNKPPPTPPTVSRGIPNKLPIADKMPQIFSSLRTTSTPNNKKVNLQDKSNKINIALPKQKIIKKQTDIIAPKIPSNKNFIADKKIESNKPIYKLPSSKEINEKIKPKEAKIKPKIETRENIKIHLSDKELDKILPISSPGKQRINPIGVGKPYETKPQNPAAEKNILPKVGLEPKKKDLNQSGLNKDINAQNNNNSTSISKDLPNNQDKYKNIVDKKNTLKLSKIKEVITRQDMPGIEPGHFDVGIKILKNQDTEDNTKDFY